VPSVGAGSHRVEGSTPQLQKQKRLWVLLMQGQQGCWLRVLQCVLAFAGGAVVTLAPKPQEKVLASQDPARVLYFVMSLSHKRLTLRVSL
jgi:hypothetical protein